MGKIVNLVRFARFLIYKILFTTRLQSEGKNFFSDGQLAIKDGGVFKLGADSVLDTGFDWEMQKGRLRVPRKVPRKYFLKRGWPEH